MHNLQAFSPFFKTKLFNSIIYKRKTNILMQSNSSVFLFMNCVLTENSSLTKEHKDCLQKIFIVFFFLYVSESSYSF